MTPHLFDVKNLQILFTVCVPELDLNKMRQDETGGQFPNCRDRDKLLIYGPIAWENPGKIWEIHGTGLPSTTWESLE